MSCRRPPFNPVLLAENTEVRRCLEIRGRHGVALLGTCRIIRFCQRCITCVPRTVLDSIVNLTVPSDAPIAAQKIYKYQEPVFHGVHQRRKRFPLFLSNSPWRLVEIDFTAKEKRWRAIGETTKAVRTVSERFYSESRV